MSLEELQNDFLQAFISNKSKPSFLKHIKKSQQLSQQDRLDIYQDSITECLANALREFYTVCEKLVGNLFFSGMAHSYIKQTPSHSPNLFDYGESFPTFVAEFKPAKSLLYLSDVCRLEWAWHRAYYAPDQQPLDFSELTKISEMSQNNLIFELPVTGTLIESTYPIHRIWEVNQERYQNKSDINLNEGGVKLLIWRKGIDLKIDLLTEKEWHLLSAINNHTPLDQLCVQLAKYDNTIDALQLLASVVRNGWIGSVFPWIDEQGTRVLSQKF